jgi:dihydroxyacetone kinase DhaKLM complex PTS-EIIA-like component DhaM
MLTVEVVSHSDPVAEGVHAIWDQVDPYVIYQIGLFA